MDFFELIVFIASVIFTFMFLIKWYIPILNDWQPRRDRSPRYVFAVLPPVSLVIIILTLKFLASFDVVDDIIYVIFYIALGFACVYLCLILMSLFFDISWRDDVINLNNKAAVISLTGGFIGLTLIYSGANIGDGPGWWCVVFAFALGIAGWIILGLFINIWTDVFERITVDRDINCAIRFGSYLLASGLILARASGGDWTSFLMTVIEFADGWPVLILTMLTIAIERGYIGKAKEKYNTGETKETHMFTSAAWGAIYIIFAVLSVILLPSFNENPFYG